MALHGIPFLLNRKSRIENLDYLLGVCEAKGWNSDTPSLAGKIETLLKPYGFTRRTNRDYVHAIIDILQSRKYGIYSSEHVQLELYRSRKKSPTRKEAKRDVNEDNPVIYSLPSFQPGLKQSNAQIPFLLTDFIQLGSWGSSDKKNSGSVAKFA